MYQQYNMTKPVVRSELISTTLFHIEKYIVSTHFRF